MTYFQVQRFQETPISCGEVQDFLFDMIQEEFGYGYIPDYHQDIQNMEDYYLKPDKNNLLIALDDKSSELIGTIGIRAYDKDFPLFKEIYYPHSTASLWRVFVNKSWRRKGVASTLVSQGEEFCHKKGYEDIYLHTHRTVPGSLNFWLAQGYHITVDTKNEMGTVHMEKQLNNPVDRETAEKCEIYI
ncbi:MAG: GNAT family N-acetyltransferase [Euryarchaeota archaeon]|nr:GNAT family N-acetyltransferase [Euryarchaeota archaeon]MBV1729158.1 GNAT family N-acetyltransferase [Methanobacterium sp.]MBU4547365.1 GNAT family N-acetyltransferase [Euryarchaeota archaeon]MBU4607497.1 GNAT family N-acetyltransferase [Euryarchaeota archaeon]MBV1754718.1 GNAT family N-acetyltransferase [Methanobacterium sp.]